MKSTAPVVAALKKNVGELSEKQKQAAEAAKNQGIGIRSFSEQFKGFTAGFREGGKGLVQGLEALKERSRKLREETNFVLDASKDSFARFSQSVSTGIDELFSTALTGKTEKFKETWKNFTKDLQNSFFKMLGNIAAGFAKENLLKPALKIGEQFLGEAISFTKNIFGFAEGGLVTRPTLGVLGEAGPELVVPLAKIGGKNVLKDLILGAELAKRGVGPTAFPLAA